MRFKVEVWLKDKVEDPEGIAVEKALKLLGFEGVREVRVGKVYSISLESGDEEYVKDMCEKLLTNAVIHKYKIYKDE